MQQEASPLQRDGVLLQRVALPLAHLYKRAINAKNTLEMHQTSFALWEATIKLQGATAIVLFPPEKKVFLDQTESSEDDTGAFASTIDISILPEEKTAEETEDPDTSFQAALSALTDSSNLLDWWHCLHLLCSLKPIPQTLSSPFALWVRAPSCASLPLCVLLFDQIQKLKQEPPLDPQDLTFPELIKNLDWYKEAFTFAELSEPKIENFKRQMSYLMLEAWEEYTNKFNELLGFQLAVIEKVKQESAHHWHIECTSLQGETPTLLEPYQVESRTPENLPVEGRIYLLRPMSEDDGGLEDTVVSGDYLDSWKDLEIFMRYTPETQTCFLFERIQKPDQARYLNYHSGVEKTFPIRLPENQNFLLPSFGGTILKNKQPNKDSNPSQQKLSITPIASSSPITPKMPKRIGEFEIISFLGEGGMGTVYRAIQPTLGRQVALKTLQRLGSPTAEQRFHREIQALGRIEHPHLVKIYTSGAHEHQWYYAMELIEGADLSRTYKQLTQDPKGEIHEQTWCEAIAKAQQDAKQQELLLSREDVLGRSDTAPLQVQFENSIFSNLLFEESEIRDTHITRIVDLLRQVATATHALHEAGVIHRDIKPGNIMLTKDGTQAVLMDLGLAQISDESNSQLTVSHQFMGTPLYASPEQCMGMAHLDRRTDVYSLGATLWELLTFQQLFSFENKRLPEILEMIRFQEPTPPSQINQKIPQDLESIILKSLEKNRNRRYPTSRLFAEDLERWLKGEPVLAQPPTLGYLFTKFLQRNKAKFIGACSVVLVVMLAIVVAFVWINEARKTAVSAQLQEKTAKTQALTAKRQLQHAHQSLLELNTHLKAQKEAALQAKNLEEQARQKAEESRRRLLQVQYQILKERLHLLHNQKRLKRSPSNTILSFFSQVLRDSANPLGHRKQAAKGIGVLLARNENKLQKQFDAIHLIELSKALLWTLNQPKQKAPQTAWLQLKHTTAYSLLLLRNHLPEVIEFKGTDGLTISPLDGASCPKWMIRQGQWLSRTQMLLRCARKYADQHTSNMLLLTQLTTVQRFPKRAIPIWKQIVHRSKNKRMKKEQHNKTKEDLHHSKLKQVALQIANYSEMKLYQQLLPNIKANLKAQNKKTRIAAITTLGHWTRRQPSLGNQIYHALILSLRKDSLLVKEQVVQVLGQIAQVAPMTSQPILNALFEAAHDNQHYWKSWRIRARALQQLENNLRTHPGLFTAMLPWLKRDLKQKNWRVRRIALHIIERMIRAVPQRANALLPWILRASKDPHRWPRLAAFQSLRSLIIHVPSLHKWTLSLLLRGVQDKAHWVQTAAWSGLERWVQLGGSGSDILPYLTQSAQSQNGYVQEAAIEVIETSIRKRPSLLPHLLPLLQNAINSRHWQVRRTTSKVLGQIMHWVPKTHVPVIATLLSQRLRDSSDKTRLAAAVALARVPHSFDLAKLHLLRHFKRESQQRSAQKRRSIFRIIKYLVASLPKQKKQLFSLIRQGTKDKKWFVRKAAVRALGTFELRKNKEFPQLMKTFDHLAKDQNATVRATVAETLGQISTQKKERQRILSWLLRATEDAAKPVRKAAMLALNKLLVDFDGQKPWLSSLLQHVTHLKKGKTDEITIATIRLALLDVSIGMSILTTIPQITFRHYLYDALSHPSMLPQLTAILQGNTGAQANQWLDGFGLSLDGHVWLSPSAETRGKAAELLGATCHPDAIKPLLDNFQKIEHPAIRARILLALGRLGRIDKHDEIKTFLEKITQSQAKPIVKKAATSAIQLLRIGLSQTQLKREDPRFHHSCLRFAHSVAHQITHEWP